MRGGAYDRWRLGGRKIPTQPNPKLATPVYLILLWWRPRAATAARDRIRWRPRWWTRTECTDSAVVSCSTWSPRRWWRPVTGTRTWACAISYSTGCRPCSGVARSAWPMWMSRPRLWPQSADWAALLYRKKKRKKIKKTVIYTYECINNNALNEITDTQWKKCSICRIVSLKI